MQLFPQTQSMSILKIPSSELSVLKKIVDLDEASFLELVAAIEGSDVKLLRVDITSLLSPKVPSIKKSELGSILRTVHSLYSIMKSRDSSAKNLATDLKETIEAGDPKNFPIEKAGLIQERIEKLLGFGKAMSLASKSIDVMTEQERIFTGVRVLSDVRPVFQDSTDNISAAVVVHNLRINYFQNGERKKFTVAMNFDDVLKIKKAMERAEDKSKAIKLFIEKSGISYFEDKEE